MGTFFQQIFMKIIWSRVILPICVIHFPLGRIIRRERPRYAISCQGSSFAAFTMPGHDDVPIPFPFPLLENTPRRIPRLENEKGVFVVWLRTRVIGGWGVFRAWARGFGFEIIVIEPVQRTEPRSQYCSYHSASAWADLHFLYFFFISYIYIYSSYAKMCFLCFPIIPCIFL